MGLALDCAEKIDADLQFGEKAYGYYDVLEKAGHGPKDFGYIYQFIDNNNALS